MSTFANEVSELRGYLLKFARLQLRNDTWAEDAVSETVVTAISQPQDFQHRSQLKTWLIGILKHKVVDALRHESRKVCFSSANEDDVTDPFDYIEFKPDGHFAELPADWGDPEATFSSRQFFEILELCSEKLPAVQGRLFLMREWLELSSQEICKELQLTPTNLYVQLHRARLRMRECIELHWVKRK